MDTKVKVTMLSKRVSKKQRWWVLCPLCKVRMHMRKRNWVGAIYYADQHVRGKQHIRKLKQIH